jgi:hypothetical protein
MAPGEFGLLFTRPSLTASSRQPLQPLGMANFPPNPSPPAMLQPFPRHPLSEASTPTLAYEHLPIELQSFCVVGGGTGCNAILAAFSSCRMTTYIVPISDDGGSSSEVQRVLGA